MARKRTLYEQLEAGLGMTVAEARFIEDDRHIFWNGGCTPVLEYRGSRYAVAKLLKFRVPEPAEGETTLKLTRRRVWQLCDAKFCCNPNHFGRPDRAYSIRVKKALPEETQELIRELQAWGPPPDDVTSVESLAERFNPFYEREAYVGAIQSGLLPEFRFLLKPGPVSKAPRERNINDP